MLRPVLLTILIIAVPGAVRLPATGPRDDRAAISAALTRLRTEDLTIARAIRRAYDLSPTFKQLVNSIARSDLIVHLERHNRFGPRDAGRFTFLGEAGGQRYVQIQLSTRLNDRELLLLIAHELTHAAEVAQASSVVDVKTLEDLYCRIGDVSSHGYDTDAARKMAEVVEEEIGHSLDR